MNIKEVKDLIHEILRSDIREFELEHTGTKLKFRRGSSPQEGNLSVQPAPPPPAEHYAPSSTSALAPAVESDSETETQQENGLHFITSPIVGTFYRAPAPGADPFVKVGATVEEGTILCVVEAMKLMNEIPSDVAGEVVRIYVENNRPVEFGQRLLAIRPRK
jgi:acetyl-CoA carboxylase biotin carboxyl carrier protein